MSVGPGSIMLYSAAVPALLAGDYTLRLEHRIDDDAVQPVEQAIRVVAPQFALSGTEVASVFPPPRATGSFGTRLPEIVLGRRTLPWERRLGTEGDATPAPWLALVVLTPDEGKFCTGVRVAQVIPADKHAALGVTDASGTCDCLDVSPEVVHAVFPRADELGWLCHVREVSLDDTELAGTDQDGFFSVVLSARLPCAPGPYSAYLISLEGRGGVLPTQPPATTPGAAATAPLRFPVLAHWDFTVGAGGDFQSLAQAIDVGSFGTSPGGCPGVTPTGHVATLHRTRPGRETAAWYRGPLTPREVGRREPVPLFHADQARRIASDGLEDLSEAAAFELGRLLALADPTFTAAVQEWHRADFADGVASETFGSVPGVTELGLGDAAYALALAAVTALDPGPPGPPGSGPSGPLGATVPRFANPVPITLDDVRRIAEGFGLDPRLVNRVLDGSPFNPDIEEPDGYPAAAAEGFDQLMANPGLLEHLHRALRQRVAATKAAAGLEHAGFDPAAASATIPQVFGGGGP